MVKIAFQDKIYRHGGLIFNFLFILASLLLILFSWPKRPPEVPVFYSRPWGEEILSSPSFLFVFPLSASFFLCLNFFISLTLSQNRLLTIVLTLTSILFSFLAFMAVLKIISLTF